MQIILFEDELTDRLAPLACAEPAFAITCGGYKLIQLISSLGPESTIVRKHLARVEAETFPQRTLPQKPLAGPVLFVNARLVPSMAVFTRLKALADAGREGVVLAGDQKNQIAAALVNLDAHRTSPGVAPPGPRQSLHSSNRSSSHRSTSISHSSNTRTTSSATISPAAVKISNTASALGPPQSYPTAASRVGSQPEAPHAGYREVRDGVFVAENVTLGEHLVTDTKNGPIVIDHEAAVGPFCFLRGPVYIGPCAKVNEHASLKDCVSLGHHTKVGGEVEGCIIEPFTNKQHAGFLGHSYVGSWVNIGAGTSNSDLKNTYGTVNMQYARQKSLHRPAIRRLLHRRLRQNRHQHQHLHRKNHRRLQPRLRIRHHQRPQLLQLCPLVGIAR